MIPRATCEEAFHAAVAAQHAELPKLLSAALRRSGHAKRARFGVAIGKAALSMARALGAVVDGIAVAPHDDGAPLPAGWRRMVSSHPQVDERAIVAGDAVLEVVQRAPADAVIVVLVSGGGSALVEAPRVPLDELQRAIAAMMRSGAGIAELNHVRSAASAIKGGQLLAHAVAPVATLAISDVIGDDLATIASGPTIWRDAIASHERAVEALRAFRVDLVLPAPFELPRQGAYAEVVVPMDRFARRVRDALAARGAKVGFRQKPFAGCVGPTLRYRYRGEGYNTVETRRSIAWGELATELPDDPGEGGRMQQYALHLAREIRGTARSVFAVGSDGIDGPPPEGRPAPAGAYVDGETWERIVNPDLALARCNAGAALDAIGALVITGPTGVNSADVVVVG